MSKTAKGRFTPKNPEKYQGKYPITYRSSWEMTVMNKLDTHPYVMAWSSESQVVYYMHPYTLKKTPYIPDFLIKSKDRNGRITIEMVEVKPAKEHPLYEAKLVRGGGREKISEKTKMAQNINRAKWIAAQAYCAHHGWKFTVWTENEIFAYERK